MPPKCQGTCFGRAPSLRRCCTDSLSSNSPSWCVKKPAGLRTETVIWSHNKLDEHVLPEVQAYITGTYLVGRVSRIHNEHRNRAYTLDYPMSQSTQADFHTKTSHKPLLDRIHLVTLELDMILSNFKTRFSSDPALPDRIPAHPCPRIERRTCHDGSCRAGARTD